MSGPTAEDSLGLKNNFVCWSNVSHRTGAGKDAWSTGKQYAMCSLTKHQLKYKTLSISAVYVAADLLPVPGCGAYQTGQAALVAC